MVGRLFAFFPVKHLEDNLLTKGEGKMNMRKYLADFALTFIFAFVAGVIVTFVFSLLVHGQGIVDWETAFLFAIMFGIVLPWRRQRGH